MARKKKTLLKVEEKEVEWISRLAASDFKWLGTLLLKELRLAWRHRPGPVDSGPQASIALPTGPYAAGRKGQMGDLLLWVPRRIDSFIIDDLTGGYGYSHISVDTGEVDVPTGKPVMAEVTVGETVGRKFQDEFGGRAFGRIPLSKTGVDVEAFVTCVKSRLGEPYDDLEALTLGEIDDPAKQVCSSLASECLPEAVLHEIAKAGRLGLLRRNSVSVHSSLNASETKIFISPNGFAQYYRAPKGNKLRGPDILIKPRPMKTSVKGMVRENGWKAVWVLGSAAALAAGTLLLLLKNRVRKNS